MGYGIFGKSNDLIVRPRENSDFILRKYIFSARIPDGHKAKYSSELCHFFMFLCQ